MLRQIAIFAAVAAGVSAQASSLASSASSVISSAASTVSASSSKSQAPVTHTVAVAKGSHSYAPDVIVAEVGDVIEFQFYPTNHSVIRMAYGYPCVPYEMIEGAGHYGFYSGPQPVDTVLTNPPTWRLTINDTDPVFFYCGAINSCIGYQMLGAINPNASTSLQTQKQLAGQATFMLNPGQDWPDEGSIPSGVATTTRSPSPTSTTGPATVTATPVAAATSSHGLSTGAIVGIAIGGAALLLIAGFGIWFCGRQSRKNHNASNMGPNGPVGPAQEYQHAYNPMTASIYGKPGHMSSVSGGYSMPPGYADQPHQPMHSPTMHSLQGHPTDPRMLHSGSVSPNFMATAPAYGQNNLNSSMYSPGTHNIHPVEMDSSRGGQNRASLDKQGVERYS